MCSSDAPSFEDAGARDDVEVPTASGGSPFLPSTFVLVSGVIEFPLVGEGVAGLGRCRVFVPPMRCVLSDAAQLPFLPRDAAIVNEETRSVLLLPSWCRLN